MNATLFNDKAQTRREMRSRRAALANRAALSQAIVDRLKAFLRAEFKKLDNATIAIYLATPHEADIDDLALWLLELGARVVAPILSESENCFATMQSTLSVPDAQSTLSAPDTPAQDGRPTWCVRVGRFGVREPHDDSARVAMREIDCVLVPCLAFDLRGARLGQGGGWYDKVLCDAKLTVGVAFETQIIERVPTETHDVGVAIIVTEARVIRATAI